MCIEKESDSLAYVNKLERRFEGKTALPEWVAHVTFQSSGPSSGYPLAASPTIGVPFQLNRDGSLNGGLISYITLKFPPH